MENAVVRVPSLAEMEVVKLINGPEAFTPDGEFILGPSDVRGFWVAAGFCAHGLAGAGGMGKLVAEWIVDGHALARRLAHGLAPLRYRLSEPRVHARAHERDLRDVLRRQVPGSRALRGAPASRLARVHAPSGARCRLRREVRLGAGQLVRAQCCEWRRVAPPARVGGKAVVAGDRGRARRVSRDGGALRRDLIREDSR